MAKKSTTSAPRKAATKKSTKPKFDSTKNYQWQPTTNFTFSGVEYSIIYSTLKELAYNPNGTSPQAIIAAFNAAHAKLVTGIEEGVIIEAQQPVQQTN